MTTPTYCRARIGSTSHDMSSCTTTTRSVLRRPYCLRSTVDAGDAVVSIVRYGRFQITGSHAGSLQLVPHTTDSSSDAVPHTTLSDSPAVPHTTLSSSALAAASDHVPEQLLPPQAEPQTALRVLPLQWIACPSGVRAAPQVTSARQALDCGTSAPPLIR